MKILLVGMQGATHIAASFLRAKVADTTLFVDADKAHGKGVVQKIFWHFLDRRPIHLRSFGEQIARICLENKPDLVVTTGISPLDAECITKIRRLGISSVNYLTDDPWNPTFRCRWFYKALPHYESIFSVRHANMEDLKNLGCRQVIYLPFGYDADLFFPENPTDIQKQEHESDVLFVGGADKDRLPYITALLRAGFKVRICGAYWNRFSETRPYAMGLQGPREIRLATACTKVSLCLIRRANRDDNCMRSFEIPAIGACMLAEDTVGHRDVFGEEGQAVLYFKTPEDMLEKTRYLLEHEAERMRLAQAAHTLIQNGKHTYRDRLQTMISVLS